jgi:hypothetical protein
MAAESHEGKWPMRGRLGGSGVDGPRDSYTDSELYRGQHQGVGRKGVTPAATRLGQITWQQL